ncbi:hypothetical protein A2954_01965 [Candidatus Roizmanbacteria bacterium RIFCSPLOWO2_01_FULL_37_12]|uniref:Cupin type-2 domain-containing protein n=1 Tax=Candidatus Roizmanbacteria bacterium RIFCSPLOWO2_01_FULL_37_12 TaxID=1802056 RepID=A0A1F7I9K9_9BACT|nr:MAG: hypothetical protein A2768_01450 [Candidatus Roizmanbacteria bacterium RIFCSPHIGHO2_01_FULL_37_16]OGK23286.1 MAG: hypothetical protein A3D76_00685 [Candidatus Roizmanbacteria bacterium RIFCSPHIGHO2_02_FULL_37_9b]OGK40058.1 MAG: hypothetical protein A2954_01965 [Candidatus Roizmanbacteria bacterium RIFCSPLOWO2_01_FULL_37_12]
MKIAVINPEQVKSFSRDPIEVFQLLNNVNTENISVSVIKLNGVNKKNRNRVSDVCYFVLEGEGKFNIDGKDYSVKKHDLVTIPKNTWYFDTGKMTLLSFCNPRFDMKNVEIID